MPDFFSAMDETEHRRRRDTMEDYAAGGGDRVEYAWMVVGFLASFAVFIGLICFADWMLS